MVSERKSLTTKLRALKGITFQVKTNTQKNILTICVTPSTHLGMKWNLKENIWELTKKKSEPEVVDNGNKCLIEPYGDLVDAALAYFQDNEMNYNIDSHGQQENEDPVDHSENIEHSDSIGETNTRRSMDLTITTLNRETVPTNDDNINYRQTFEYQAKIYF